MADPLALILTPANLSTAIVAVNFLAFAAFGLDKAKAEAGKRRIPEADLLTLALLGGTPGAYAGRALFRHKTRKQPFSARFTASPGCRRLLSSGGSAGLSPASAKPPSSAEEGPSSAPAAAGA
jgi:uncharacterized membrane protein YsdA (DUF1294 family)